MLIENHGLEPDIIVEHLPRTRRSTARTPSSTRGDSLSAGQDRGRPRAGREPPPFPDKSSRYSETTTSGQGRGAGRERRTPTRLMPTPLPQPGLCNLLLCFIVCVKRQLVVLLVFLAEHFFDRDLLDPNMLIGRRILTFVGGLHKLERVAIDHQRLVFRVQLYLDVAPV